MRKRFFLFIVLLYNSACFIHAASATTYFSTSYLWSYDTNIYSSPLVINADAAWLNWRLENPYIQRFNNGVELETKTFFSDNARTGISFSFSTSIAYSGKNIFPTGDFNKEWTYSENNDISKLKAKLFLGIGPSFRMRLGTIDLGLNCRLSVGAFDFKWDEIIIGLQAKPYLNVFLSNNVYLDIGLNYDAHLMCIYTNNSQKYYKDNFTLITSGASIGVGVLIGNETEKRYE